MIRATKPIKSIDEIEEFPLLPHLSLSEIVPKETTMPGTQEKTYVQPSAQDKPSPQFPLAEDVNLVVGPLKIEASRKNHRCNITHSETMETAFIKISEKICGGEVEFKRLSEHSFDCATWNLLVQFPEAVHDALQMTFKEWGVAVKVWE